MVEQEYQTVFVWIRRRSDGRWFFFTEVEQLHVKLNESLEMRKWYPIRDMIYDAEELSIMRLQGNPIKLNEDKYSF